MTASAQRSLDSVRIVRVYPGDRDDVWQRLIDENTRLRWWPTSAIDFTPGGSISSTQNSERQTERVLSGQIDTCVEGHALGFSWKAPYDRHDTSVLITVMSLLGTVQLSVLELGFLGLRDGEARIAESYENWVQRLDALDAVLGDSTVKA